MMLPNRKNKTINKMHQQKRKKEIRFLLTKMYLVIKQTIIEDSNEMLACEKCILRLTNKEKSI